MPHETKDLKDHAVYWEATGLDRRGRVTITEDGPIDIKCRWEEMTRQTLDGKGDPITISARVAVAIDIPDNSILWHGRLVDLPADGTPPSGIMRVMGRERSPDIKSRHVRRVLTLTRHNAELPDVTA